VFATDTDLRTVVRVRYWGMKQDSRLSCSAMVPGWQAKIPGQRHNLTCQAVQRGSSSRHLQGIMNECIHFRDRSFLMKMHSAPLDRHSSANSSRK
jgi:hypothetical protein